MPTLKTKDTSLNIIERLKSPLFASWPEQYVRIRVVGLETGAAVVLRVDGSLTDFQYTGEEGAGGAGDPGGAGRPGGAEIMVRLGFAAGETKTLELTSSDSALSATDFRPLEIRVENGARIGVPNNELTIAPPVGTNIVDGPFAGFAGFALRGRIICSHVLEHCRLTRTAAGPLYLDYLLDYRFAGDRRYSIGLRCYRDTPLV